LELASFNGCYSNMKSHNHWLAALVCWLTVGAAGTGLANTDGTDSSSWVATADGVVGLWHGEGNGNDAVNSNNATLFGGVAFDKAVIGLGFKCNGVDSHILVPDTPVLNFAAKQDFSIEDNDSGKFSSRFYRIVQP